MMRFVALLLTLAAISGCGPRTVRILSPFDSVAARSMLEPGDNRITGSAVIRQQGGGTVTCAGFEVNLLPATAYAVERMKHLYGSDQRGYYAYEFMKRGIRFQPDLQEYHDCTLSTLGDAQGSFEFNGIADGEYFIVTEITWVIQYSHQGGALMQRVSVAGGETKKVVLAAP